MCSGEHLFALIYFSLPLLASWSTWRCSCCASCYAMTFGVLGLMLWSEIFGTWYYVVLEKIVCGCRMWTLLHITWCFSLMIVWFPYVGILFLAIKIVGWCSTLDDDRSICCLLLLMWEAWMLIDVHHFSAMYICIATMFVRHILLPYQMELTLFHWCQRSSDKGWWSREFVWFSSMPTGGIVCINVCMVPASWCWHWFVMEAISCWH